MKWAPFESYIVESTESATSLISRLQARTEKSRVFGLKRPDANFYGRIAADRICLRPILPSGDSFSPELRVRIENRPEGSRLLVDMIPCLAARMIVAALVVALGLMVFRNGPFIGPAIAGFVSAAWFCAMAGLWLERGAARKILLEIATKRAPAEQPIGTTESTCEPSDVRERNDR